MTVQSITINCFSLLLILISGGCSSRKGLENANIAQRPQKEILLQELRLAQNQIVSFRDTLTVIVTSREDRLTPAKYLIDEGRAKLIKHTAERIVLEFPAWKSELVPLLKILESCEGQKVEWDEYCFRNMPYFGVEPILNAWIMRYDLAIGNVSKHSSTSK